MQTHFSLSLSLSPSPSVLSPPLSPLHPLVSPPLSFSQFKSHHTQTDMLSTSAQTSDQAFHCV